MAAFYARGVLEVIFTWNWGRRQKRGWFPPEAWLLHHLEQRSKRYQTRMMSHLINTNTFFLMMLGKLIALL